MTIRLRILLLNCLLFGGFTQLAGQGQEAIWADGLAVVTTCKGDVIFKSPLGDEKHAELHDVGPLTGLEVTSEKNEYTFLSLSNGSALGIYQDSNVRFESYRQLPFTPDEEALEYEPTFSNLVIELRTGSLSFSAERLSPRSVILIQLPSGQIEVRNASGRVLYDEDGAEITITAGIVTYNYPGTGEQDFINAPYRVRISQQDAKLGRFTEIITPDTGPDTLTGRLVNATHRARDRVIFKVPSKKASIPRPILVARPDDLLKPSPRPYQYLD